MKDWVLGKDFHPIRSLKGKWKQTVVQQEHCCSLSCPCAGLRMNKPLLLHLVRMIAALLCQLLGCQALLICM